MNFTQNKALILILLLLMLSNTTPAFSQTQPPIVLEWETPTSIFNKDASPSLGFAGPINGLHNNVLIVAGGANFPDKMPWEGGQKKYSAAVHILEKKGKKYQWNTKTKAQLPEPIAYSGVTTTPLGVVYVGGENQNGLSDKAYLLRWEKDTNDVLFQALPSFPKPIANIALTTLGSVIYAVGGDQAQKASNHFYSLDLKAVSPHWQQHQDLPLALAHAVAVVQETPEGPCLFVMGGRTKTDSGISTLHSSGFAYHFGKKQWTTIAAVSDGTQTTTISAGTAVAFGKRSVLLLGGDTGGVFHQIETYLSQIAQASSPEEKQRLLAQKNELVTRHEGFYKGILCYDTHTNSWEKIGELPFLTPVTTTALYWEKHIIISNGEIKPGIRTPDIRLGKIKK